MRILFSLGLYLGFISQIFGQNAVEIANVDNVKIQYSLTRLESKETKEKYLIQVNVVNNNSYPMYYVVPGIVNEDKSVTMDPLNLNFAKIKIRNSTGLFGDGIGLAGDNSNMKTISNGFLFALMPGKIYNFETTFKVKTGDLPLVTNTVKSNLNKLSNFDVKINSANINGIWSSTCSSMDLSLTFEENIGGISYIIQSVNGKQSKWLKQTEMNFTRENDNSTTLTYQKANNTFLFSSSDGISCTLTKKN
jgi:hypothetical protein